MINYDSLLQNATDFITKYDSYFITKCDRSLLKNESGFLLQNATVLLQNATVITKCDVYYKLRQYTKLKSLKHQGNLHMVLLGQLVLQVLEDQLGRQLVLQQHLHLQQIPLRVLVPFQFLRLSKIKDEDHSF